MKAYKYSRKNLGIDKPPYGYLNTDVTEFLDCRRNKLADYIADARLDGSLIGFIGGPPCPDFSVAGKQRGRNGDNGKLSQSYTDLIIQQHPDFFLFENVKGLWRTEKHRAFYEELKQELSGAGYCLADRLTNALEFGAPQDRDRILLFGVRCDLFADGQTDSLEGLNWTKYARYSMDDIHAIPWPARSPFIENSEIPIPKGIPAELTAEHWFRRNTVTEHPNASDYFIPRAGLIKMKQIDEGDDSKKSYKRLHRWRYSPTVAYGNNEVHLHPYKARRLSVAEALSLQTLPKGFSLPPDMSLTDKFKTTGNGVPYLLANGIARTIKEYLAEKEG